MLRDDDKPMKLPMKATVITLLFCSHSNSFANLSPSMAHKKLQDIPIEELRSKFGDSDDEDVEAASKAGASGKSEAALSGTKEVVSRILGNTAETFSEGATDDEDEDSEANLDWVDEIEGDMLRFVVLFYRCRPR